MERVVCPNCKKVNQIPKKDTYKKAICGNCKTDLLTNTIINLDDSSFDYLITNSSLPIIVDFWAPWCGPCQMFSPVFESVSKKFPLKVQFAKLNTEISQIVPSRVGIRGIPTMIVFKDGNEIYRTSGAMDEVTFSRWVEQFI